MKKLSSFSFFFLVILLFSLLSLLLSTTTSTTKFFFFVTAAGEEHDFAAAINEAAESQNSGFEAVRSDDSQQQLWKNAEQTQKPPPNQKDDKPSFISKIFETIIVKPINFIVNDVLIASFKFLAQAIETVVNSLGNFLKQVCSTILNFLKNVGIFIDKNILTPLGNGIRFLFTEIIFPACEWIWDKFSTCCVNVAEFFTYQICKPIWNFLKSAFDFLIVKPLKFLYQKVIVRFVTWFVDTCENIASFVWKWISSGFNFLIVKPLKFLHQKVIVEFVTWFVVTCENIASFVWKWISSGFNFLIVNPVKFVWTCIKNSIVWIWNTLIVTPTTFVTEKISSFFTICWKFLETFCEKISNFVGTFIIEPVETFFVNVFNFLVENVFSPVVKFLSKALKWIVNQILIPCFEFLKKVVNFIFVDICYDLVFKKYIWKITTTNVNFLIEFSTKIWKDVIVDICWVTIKNFVFESGRIITSAYNKYVIHPCFKFSQEHLQYWFYSIFVLNSDERQKLIELSSSFSSWKTNKNSNNNNGKTNAHLHQKIKVGDGRVHSVPFFEDIPSSSSSSDSHSSPIRLGGNQLRVRTQKDGKSLYLLRSSRWHYGDQQLGGGLKIVPSTFALKLISSSSSKNNKNENDEEQNNNKMISLSSYLEESFGAESFNPSLMKNIHVRFQTVFIPTPEDNNNNNNGTTTNNNSTNNNNKKNSSIDLSGTGTTSFVIETLGTSPNENEPQSLFLISNSQQTNVHFDSKKDTALRHYGVNPDHRDDSSTSSSNKLKQRWFEASRSHQKKVGASQEKSETKQTARVAKAAGRATATRIGPKSLGKKRFNVDLLIELPIINGKQRSEMVTSSTTRWYLRLVPISAVIIVGLIILFVFFDVVIFVFRKILSPVVVFLFECVASFCEFIVSLLKRISFEFIKKSLICFAAFGFVFLLLTLFTSTYSASSYRELSSSSSDIAYSSSSSVHYRRAAVHNSQEGEDFHDKNAGADDDAAVVDQHHQQEQQQRRRNYHHHKHHQQHEEKAATQTEGLTMSSSESLSATVTVALTASRSSSSISTASTTTDTSTSTTTDKSTSKHPPLAVRENYQRKRYWTIPQTYAKQAKKSIKGNDENKNNDNNKVIKADTEENDIFDYQSTMQHHKDNIKHDAYLASESSSLSLSSLFSSSSSAPPLTSATFTMSLFCALIPVFQVSTAVSVLAGMSLATAATAMNSFSGVGILGTSSSSNLQTSPKMIEIISKEHNNNNNKNSSSEKKPPPHLKFQTRPAEAARISAMKLVNESIDGKSPQNIVGVYNNFDYRFSSVGEQKASNENQFFKNRIWDPKSSSSHFLDDRRNSLVTISFYYTVAGGVPSNNDIKRAIAELERVEKEQEIETWEKLMSDEEKCQDSIRRVYFFKSQQEEGEDHDDEKVINNNNNNNTHNNNITKTNSSSLTGLKLALSDQKEFCSLSKKQGNDNNNNNVWKTSFQLVHEQKAREYFPANEVARVLIFFYFVFPVALLMFLILKKFLPYLEEEEEAKKKKDNKNNNNKKIDEIDDDDDGFENVDKAKNNNNNNNGENDDIRMNAEIIVGAIVVEDTNTQKEKLCDSFA